jgi:hypothetical protein
MSVSPQQARNGFATRDWPGLRTCDRLDLTGCHPTFYISDEGGTTLQKVKKKEKIVFSIDVLRQSRFSVRAK